MTPSYYGRPMLKQPVWKIDIPIYYWLGGAAGAALVLGAAAQLDGSEDLKRFAQRCRMLGIFGTTAGGALLVHDLGRPSRFLHMLRVFRPTSPMNLGAWILTGAAPLAIVAGMFPHRRIGQIAGYGAGLFGVALAGYTGVLLSNTAIPVYRESRRVLPVLFLASAAASAASVLEVWSDEPRPARITLAFGAAGRLGELVATEALEGVSGALVRTAGVLTASSLVLSLLRRRRLAGVFGAAGSLCLRIAVHYAGAASARQSGPA